jgi:hypothetical protein
VGLQKLATFLGRFGTCKGGKYKNLYHKQMKEEKSSENLFLGVLCLSSVFFFK